MSRPGRSFDAMGAAVAAVLHGGLLLWLFRMPLTLSRRRVVVEVEIRKPPPPIKVAPASPPPGESHSPAPPRTPPSPKVDARKPLKKVVIPSKPVPESQLAPEERPVSQSSSQPATTTADTGAAGGGVNGIPGGVPGGLPGGGPRGVPGGAALPIIGPSFDADYLKNAPPKYPAIARRLRLEGTTIIRVLVGPDGQPKNVRLQHSSGVQVLDEAALEAVQHWSFVPARQGNKPIAKEVDVPVCFRLDGTAAQ